MDVIKLFLITMRIQFVHAISPTPSTLFNPRSVSLLSNRRYNTIPTSV